MQSHLVMNLPNKFCHTSDETIVSQDTAGHGNDEDKVAQ